ncbi:MAG: hypothetical protein IKR49_05385 [Clostridia bacterium]|nr:hypothetical protein [Clostridia bacterium]
MKQTSKVLSIILALLMIFSVTVSAAASLTLDSAKIGDTDLSAATTIRSNDVIDLTFSADVTSDEAILTTNLTKIKVRNAAGEAVNGPTVSVVGKKKLSVSLGGIDKADYTLTIGKKFQDVNGNTLAADVSIPFTVNKGDGSGSGGGNNPLTFGGATVNDADLSGATLKGNETIVLQFDRGMKTYETDNAALITVKKADGSNASYTVLPVDDSNDTTKQQIKVQLGGLEDGDYTLTIGKNLKANNGNTLGTKVEINFTVKGDDQGSGNKLSSIFDTLLNFFKMIINFFKGLFTK